MSYFVILLCVFQSFSIAITSLGEERANLSTFCTFVRFGLVCFCLFLLSLGVWAAVSDCGTPWTFLLPFFGTKCRLKNFKTAILDIGLERF